MSHVRKSEHLSSVSDPAAPTSPSIPARSRTIPDVLARQLPRQQIQSPTTGCTPSSKNRGDLVNIYPLAHPKISVLRQCWAVRCWDASYQPSAHSRETSQSGNCVPFDSVTSIQKGINERIPSHAQSSSLPRFVSLREHLSATSFQQSIS
ncbi:hypothetical protein NW755_003958 [Fusarium falciforme]|uniref:Uncharacterized protein n=1 Tax=Fusarium falciforme TaxID=195108 RepID=A0A9W8RBY8_9HYPO|nr:hypothetical protein NW755_003958 [Fusarium falciforme]